MARYRSQKELHRRLVELVRAAKDDLAGYYRRPVDADDMRALKSARLEQLAAEARAELRAAGRSENHWLTGDLNNARLLPMSLYDGYLAAFLALYADCGSALDCLYEEARAIAQLDRSERHARLDALANRQQGLDRD
jgi:predicted aminopeptidase